MTVVILVGSETGNALDYGSRLRDDLERSGIGSEIFLMDEFPLDRLLEDATSLLFVCSTTGDGEEPHNMQKFMKFLLRADLPADLFSGIDFGVFGLGDSSYEKFNFVGKRVYRRMLQLGGRDLVGFRGEGDERNSKGIEGGWIKWWDGLRGKLKGTGKVYTDSEPLPPRHKLIVECTDSTDIKYNIDVKDSSDKDHPLDSISNLTSHKTNVSLLSCERVTPVNHFQDSRLVKFRTNDFKFLPGDILNLKPSNDEKEVEELINLMGWNGEMVISGIEGDNVHLNLKEIQFPMKLKSFLCDWIDFKRIPSRNIFKTLASLCSGKTVCDYSQLHYEKLLELSFDEGEYLEYVWRPKRNFLEILGDFQPTLRIEIERILQVFPVIKPRQFSIANYEDDVMELLIALIKEETPRGIIEGLCSKWIQRKTGLIDHVSISHGSLNYSIISSPKISKLFLFATGTGIAPIRSIIKNVKGKEIYLYFGFRSKYQDFYFESEWKEIQLSESNKFTLFTQGSRDVPNKKIYINDLIKSNSSPLTSLTSPEDVCCVVAGNSRLNKLIQETLNEIWSGKQQEKWLEYLKRSNQYQCETWS